MKLWYIYQDVDTGYGIYESAVVTAETEEVARMMHPCGYLEWGVANDDEWREGWCDIKNVKVRLLGEAVEGTVARVICAAYIAE
jgi:hypothetical protein